MLEEIGLMRQNHNNSHLIHTITYDDMQVRIDIIEVKLLQDVLPRGGETLELGAYAVGLKVAEQKEG